MVCKLEDLKNKTVITVKNGVNLGFVDDIVMDTYSAKVLSLVIYGKKKFFGIFGREEDVLISWSDINIIGDDVVLVDVDFLPYSHNQFKKKSFFQTLFK